MLLSLIVFSCSKIETINNETQNEKSHLRTVSESSSDTKNFTDLTSCLRDINTYSPDYLQTISRSAVSTQAGGGGGSENFHCCNGICLTVPENPDPGTFYYPFDAFGNEVQYIGQYGPDGRHTYYVSLPANVNSNSPIVVMIHGGGWFSGPNGNILGFPFNWGGDNTISIVKDLLNNGYVVVSLLYRLTTYGENNAEFTSNPIGWQEQINDIDLAINHIRSNFPSCLWENSLNANEIHLLGESAGGHLALMYAYTHPNKSYIHSVISMYAPSNMRQYADTTDNIAAHNTFTCGSQFNSNLHQPYYFPILNIYNPNEDYYSFNPFNCTVSNFGFGNSRIIPSFNLIQSSAKQSISNPSTNSTLQNFSPRFAISTANYPTFIMHGQGNSDQLVPYTKSTYQMDTALMNNGGLIGTYFYNPVWAFPPSTNIPTNYSTLPNKHVIKLYYFANHGWTSTAIPSATIPIRNKVRQDCITWLNGH